MRADRVVISAILTTVLSIGSFAAVQARIAAKPSLPDLDQRESVLWAAPVRNAEFSEVAHTSARASCQATKDPEALATPDPLIEEPELHSKFTVSFIIGTDGRVHSPFILESAASSEESKVLWTVSSWRYRPATCNGVPTESEARVEFSQKRD